MSSLYLVGTQKANLRVTHAWVSDSSNSVLTALWQLLRERKQVATKGPSPSVCRHYECLCWAGTWAGIYHFLFVGNSRTDPRAGDQARERPGIEQNPADSLSVSSFTACEKGAEDDGSDGMSPLSPSAPSVRPAWFTAVRPPTALLAF